MSEINKENLSPEVAAYIAALENKVEKLQSTVENLNEMLVKRNKMLFGRSSEKTEYIDETVPIATTKNLSAHINLLLFFIVRSNINVYPRETIDIIPFG